MATIPDSKLCTPVEFKFGDVLIAYYENPKTLGDSVGVPSLFEYPQLAVVKVAGATDPQLVVWVETSGMGDPMICSVDPDGRHASFEVWSDTDRDRFVGRVAEIASKAQILRRQPGQDKNARKAIIVCPSCHSSLRVPKFKSGRIRCPVCEDLFDAST